MSPESMLRQAIAECMIGIYAGEIVLRDEGAKTNWKVEVGAFQLASYPVTRELYRAVRGEVPASSAGPRTPVTEVCWKEAVRFCNLLSQATGLEPCYAMGDDPDGQDVVCHWEAEGYRLPSEAEWEYAYRAGTSGVRYGELGEIAWYRGNSGSEVHDVATKAPNAWGLYDMIGNVWEWCWDVYDPRVYGPYRVFRGGGWHDQPRGCRPCASTTSGSACPIAVSGNVFRPDFVISLGVEVSDLARLPPDYVAGQGRNRPPPRKSRPRLKSGQRCIAAASGGASRSRPDLIVTGSGHGMASSGSS